MSFCSPFNERVKSVSFALIALVICICVSVITVISHFIFPQELKKSGTWKPQLELYKKQICELHQRLNEETKKADKSDFECRKMQEKLNAIQREKDVSGYEECRSIFQLL
jgi:hypothetical protein